MVAETAGIHGGIDIDTKIEATKCLFECEKSCGEGHRCAKLCYEVCSPCEFRERKVLNCGHENEVGIVGLFFQDLY